MNARKLTLATLVSLCTLVGALLVGASAQAAFTHRYLSQITEVPAQGPKGPSEPVPVPGPLGVLNSMTVDGGHLWVADQVEGSATFRVDDFNAASGAFISQLAQQTPALDYTDNGVAVGHATGETELYVGTDAYPHGNPEGAVAVFGAAGELQAVWEGADTPGKTFECFQCGGSGDVAVDNSTSLGDWAAGDVYVSSPTQGVVDVFKPAAHGGEKYVTQLTGPEVGVSFSSVEAVGVSQTNGDVFVAEGGSVDVFEPTVLDEYAPVGRLTVPAGQAPGGAAISAVVVDSGTGDVYIANRASEAVDQFSASGTYIGQLTGTPSGPLEGVASVATNPENGDVYVGLKGAVDVFGPNLVIPDVTSEPASNVRPSGATLNGVVDPDGVALKEGLEGCRFEWGEAEQPYEHTAPCDKSAAEIGSGSSPVEVHAEITGLQAGGIYRFRLTVANPNGANTGLDRLVGPPRVDGESSTEPAQTTVTLQAQVDPDGVDTLYHFEYGPSSAYGTSVPVPSGDIGSGEADYAIALELAGLQAGVTYHYRVIATNAAGTDLGVDQTFTTIPPARIDSLTISDVSATSASLHAQIDPLGKDTTYRFEYGTSTAYGASTPIPDADIGSGTADIAVTQALTGLSPNTTYHVRVLAHNALGSERSADHTFVYGEGAGGLPDNRAYELVTPAQKNGALIGDVLFGPPPVIAEDGSRVILGSVQCFAGAGSCVAVRQTVGSPYLFTRTADGWVPSPLAPSAAQFETSSWGRYSADDGTALFSAPTPPSGADDLYARQPDGNFLDIGPLTPPAGGPSYSAVESALGGSVAMTADLSHVAYQSPSYWPFAPLGGEATVFEYSGLGNSAPMLVGVTGGPGSTDLISACLTQLGGSTAIPQGAMSEAGRTVYFTAGTCASGTGANEKSRVPVNELYARVDGELPDAHTVAISQPKALASASPDDACTTQACQRDVTETANWREAIFQGASRDGSKVFFTDAQQLTDGASQGSTNLYLYDFGNPAGHNLIDVSAGAAGSSGPRVQGAMAISSDGSHVYFLANGVLTGAANAQGLTAEDGANNLYVFERDSSHPDGHVTFIASLPDSDVGTWSQGPGQPANVTPDGRFLVFTSHGNLTPDSTRTDGAEQVYRYDAQSEELVRISIGEDGFNDNGNAGAGNASIVPGIHGRYPAGPGRPDPTMSDDGAYVFFSSSVGLTPKALNDVRIATAPQGGPAYAQNVYEYHEGQVYLISDGRDTSVVDASGACESSLSAVCLIGSDATGANVFFSTTDQLLPQDIDTQLDFYDARICTSSEPCIAQAPPALPPCLGEACHGTPAATPSLLTPGSSSFDGAGNLTPAPAPAAHPKSRPKSVKCGKGASKKHGRCTKKAGKKKVKRAKKAGNKRRTKR